MLINKERRMKKIVVVFLIIITVITAVSCDNTKPSDTENDNKNVSFYDRGDIAGDYIFKTALTNTSESESDFAPLLKYNIHTGDSSFVCTDPFCDHKTEDCFFYGVVWFAHIANTLYMERLDESNGKYGIYEFNVDSEEGKFIYHTDTRIEEIFQYNYYLFFREAKKQYAAVRFDVRDRSVYTINGTGFTPTSIYVTANDKIYWRASEGYYESDFDGKYIRTVEYLPFFEKYKYRTENYIAPDNKTAWFHLNVFIAEDDKGERLLFEDTGPITVFRDKLVGFDPPDNVGIDIMDLRQRDMEFTGIWVSDPDGSNKKTIVSDPERKLHIQSMSGDRTNELTCGDYIAVVLNPEGEDYHENDLLIVNVYTGEYVVSRPQFD